MNLENLVENGYHSRQQASFTSSEDDSDGDKPGIVLDQT
jgi:hypothetical protein